MSQLPLPRWTYVHGETTPITRSSCWQELLVPAAFRGYVPARHSALRYGLALTAAAPQGGREPS